MENNVKLQTIRDILAYELGSNFDVITEPSGIDYNISIESEFSAVRLTFDLDRDTIYYYSAYICAPNAVGVYPLPFKSTWTLDGIAGDLVKIEEVLDYIDGTPIEY